MPKPPASPPHSDLTGVHRDGTRPGKVIDHREGSAEQLDAARKDSKGKPPER